MELVFIGDVVSFYLTFGIRTALPGEVSDEFGAAIRLNALQSQRLPGRCAIGYTPRAS